MDRGSGPRRRVALSPGEARVERSKADRVADALERIAEVGERVVATLERAFDGHTAKADRGPPRMTEIQALPSRPRSEFITQKNCQGVLGLPPRQFLELLRREDAPPVSTVGKLRVVRSDAMFAYVERLGAKVRDNGDGEEAPDGAEAVLREINCAPVRR